jgi:hypothetical protein
MVAHKEACQVFIEQEIQEGLAQGKTPYSIGKDLSAWVEKLFETSIPATTIEKRAERIKNPTNVGNVPTSCNPNEIKEKQELQGVRPQTQMVSPQPSTPDSDPAKKPGPGRHPKYPQPHSDAIHWATVAISQLSRIEDGDPKREQALNKVVDWINSQLEVAIRPKKRR